MDEFSPPYSEKLDVDKHIIENFKLWLNIEHDTSSNIDKLNSVASFPIPYIFAKFASKAYENCGETEKQLKKYEEDLPQGWKLLTHASSSNGYYGVAYWHSDCQQVVIAHRGTEFGLSIDFLLDLFADFKGIVANEYVAQMNSAITFSYKVNETLFKSGLNFQLFFTGHSLGGWLAQITSLTTKYLTIKENKFLKDPNHMINEHHAHTVVFDSPGCKEMLSQMESDFDIRYNDLSAGRSIFIKNLDITSYLSAPNRINTSNHHIGKLYRIFVDLSDWKLYEIYDKATHSLDRILKAFEGNNLKILDVVDWPIRKGLGEKEFNSFFKWAEYSNDYNPETVVKEFQGYSSIRYQTKPFNEQECSINIFTQSEQEFLRKYQAVRDFEFFELKMLHCFQILRLGQKNGEKAFT